MNRQPLRERILVIEDDAEIAHIVRHVLTHAQYEVLVASNGRMGLDKALHERPALILLDLNLPQMSGMEVLRALRDQGSQVPVILVTVQRSESIALQALRLGVRDYLQKPFAFDELLGAVERALQETQSQRERDQLLEKLEQTNRTLESRMRELSSLQSVGRSVATLATQDKVLIRITDTAVYLTEAQAVALFLPEADGQKLSLEAVQWNIGHQMDLWIRTRDQHAQQVLKSGQVTWIDGVRDSEAKEGRAHTVLYVPINLGDQVIGVMGAAFPRRQEPDPELENRLSTLADYAAIALKNAQLYEASRQQARRLAMINQTAHMITSSLELNEVMQAIVHSINQILHVQAGSLALLDPESGELVFHINLRGDTEQLAPYRLQVGEGIIGWVVETGRPARINDVRGDPRFCDDIDQAIDFHTRSVLCVPLIVADTVIGALEVINKLESKEGGHKPFTAQDETLLRSIAAFVAMAVENARLHQAVREIVAAQTLHNTVVTLSHHINNPLQVLFGVAHSLRTESEHPVLADALERESAKIAIVLSILRDLVSPESTFYLNATEMFDIEAEIERRLAQTGRQTKLLD